MTRKQNDSRPSIDSLRIKNYRVLHDLEIGPFTEFTVFVGPNGSGKSTLFDVLAFIQESFSEGLARAWARRGGFREMRTRGASGPITIELTYREEDNSPLLTYHLTIQENGSGLCVMNEWLGKPDEYLLHFTSGKGWLMNGQKKDVGSLDSPDILAASVFGQLTNYPKISTLRRFVTSWHFSNLSQPRDNAKNGVIAKRLSATGDNLPNVLQYWEQQYPEQLETVFKSLSRYVPHLERIETVRTFSGHLLLQQIDSTFKEPIPARFASDGTLKLLASLLQLHDPHLPPVIGLEEPENHVHPHLLPELADECSKAANLSQLLVITHSPYFVNSLKPKDVWVLYRNACGFTEAQCAADMLGIKSFMENGAQLGALWTALYFETGNPLD